MPQPTVKRSSDRPSAGGGPEASSPDPFAVFEARLAGLLFRRPMDVVHVEGRHSSVFLLSDSSIQGYALRKYPGVVEADCRGLGDEGRALADAIWRLGKPRMKPRSTSAALRAFLEARLAKDDENSSMWSSPSLYGDRDGWSLGDLLPMGGVTIHAPVGEPLGPWLDLWSALIACEVAVAPDHVERAEAFTARARALQRAKSAQGTSP